MQEMNRSKDVYNFIETTLNDAYRCLRHWCYRFRNNHRGRFYVGIPERSRECVWRLMARKCLQPSTGGWSMSHTQ